MRACLLRREARRRPRSLGRFERRIEAIAASLPSGRGLNAAARPDHGWIRALPPTLNGSTLSGGETPWHRCTRAAFFQAHGMLAILELAREVPEKG